MNKLIILARQQVRVNRLPLWVWSGLFLLMGLGVAASAPAVVSNGSAEDMLKKLGMGSLVADGPKAFLHPADWFVTFKMLAWLPQFASIFAAITALQVVLKEEDSRTAEYLLSLPVSRGVITIGRLMALFLSITILVAACIVGLALGAVSVKVDVSTGRYILAGIGSIFTAFTMGVLSLLVSMCFRSYGKALRYSLGITIGLFLLDIVMKFANPDPYKEWLGKLTPFGWFDATLAVRNGDPQLLGILASAIAAILLTLWATKLFRNREVM